MDVSELREKPAGRQPIDTRAVASSRIDEVMEAVGRALDKGKLVYWIVRWWRNPKRRGQNI